MTVLFAVALALVVVFAVVLLVRQFVRGDLLDTPLSDEWRPR